jgi:hypothetical protein
MLVEVVVVVVVVVGVVIGRDSEKGVKSTSEK